MKEMKKQLKQVKTDVSELKLDMGEVKSTVARYEVLLEAHAGKLLEHDDRFDRLENQLASFRREVLAGQDKMITIMQRGEQERLFMLTLIQRNQSAIEGHDKELVIIKEHVGIE